MKQKTKKASRLLALLLALAIVCSFFSVFPLYRYPGHRCDETHCVLCTVAHAADALLRQTQALCRFVLPLLALCLFLLLRAFLLRCTLRAPDTPVTLKTKILG